MNSQNVQKQTRQDEDCGYACARVLQNTANELRALTDKTAHIQTVIGKLMATCSADATDTLHDLQSLDHITQSIEGLAHFLDALSGDTPAHWQYPDLVAVNKVKLAELAQSLLSSTDCEPIVTESVSGEMDLF
ncbi:MAG: hypothetical protein JKX72_05650 [Robiginitomaculum sp.]|nr:hypothetical protein [Robiginitomaculum sp.]